MMGEEKSKPLFIRLYLDEDVFKAIAPVLRARGFAAVSVHDLQHYGWSDIQHLAYATGEGGHSSASMQRTTSHYMRST